MTDIQVAIETTIASRRIADRMGKDAAVHSLMKSFPEVPAGLADLGVFDNDAVDSIARIAGLEKSEIRRRFVAWVNANR